MKSMLHCLWTGPSFPFSLRCFIIKWVQYLRLSHSNFEVILWVTNDSLEAMKKYLDSTPQHGNKFENGPWSRCMVGCDVSFKKIKLKYNTFYIASCEEELKRYPADLETMFKIFSKGKRYTTISNIGRVMAINVCGGIYTDIDYLLPVVGTFFPKDLSPILDVFEDCSEVGLYMPVVELGKTFLIENQCLVLDPRKVGILTPLIRQISSDLIRDFAQICSETKDHQLFVENEVTRGLNRSLFMDGLFKELLEAYNRRDINSFDAINAKLFKDQYVTSYSFADSGVYACKIGTPMLSGGDRHDGYEKTSNATYTSVTNYFNKKLKLNYVDFLRRYWRAFLIYFDTNTIDSQFVFIDKREGRKRGMYSWANPGYSRLRSLEQAALFVQQRYREKKYYVRKDLVLELMHAVEFECREIMEEGRLKVFDCINKGICSIKNQYLSKEDAAKFLKEFLSVCCLQISIAPSKIGLEAVETLNYDYYELLRKIIDPEKEQLTYEDVRAFALF
ncbi:hypothetical protein AAEX28_00430 [Lentisphaerota bacterium WC36G]|nr:hypothetical protein LJT99_03310 [Lentisphaerae bacterium WC36]